MLSWLYSIIENIHYIPSVYIYCLGSDYSDSSIDDSDEDDVIDNPLGTETCVVSAHKAAFYL